MPSQPMFRRRVRRTSSTPRRSRLRLRPYCVARRRAMARTSSRMRSWSRRSMADSRVWRASARGRPRHARPLDRRRAGAEDKADPALRQEMLSIGIQPDILLCRSDRASPASCRQDRPVLQCRRPGGHRCSRCRPIYEVPLNFAQEGVDALASRTSNGDPAADLRDWKQVVEHAHNKDEVHIGIVGSMSSTRTATNRSRKRSSTARSRTT